MEHWTTFNLKLSPEKAHVGAISLKFSRRVDSSDSVIPDPEKAKAIVAMPTTTNVSLLRSALGALSYYGRFLAAMSSKTRLLKKDVPFEFTA